MNSYPRRSEFIREKPIYRNDRSNSVLAISIR